jgi:hypothetical protein
MTLLVSDFDVILPKFSGVSRTKVPVAQRRLVGAGGWLVGWTYHQVAYMAYLPTSTHGPESREIIGKNKTVTTAHTRRLQRQPP